MSMSREPFGMAVYPGCTPAAPGPLLPERVWTPGQSLPPVPEAAYPPDAWPFAGDATQVLPRMAVAAPPAPIADLDVGPAMWLLWLTGAGGVFVLAVVSFLCGVWVG